MNNLRFYLIVAFAFTCFSCKQNLPEHFGIYVENNGNFHTLNPQKTNARGTIVESVSGIKGSSGFCIKNINSIVVYKEQINSELIRISKLDFVGSKSFKGIMGYVNGNVNLWINDQDLPINISPVKNRDGMYRITFKQELTKGFYAVHFGSLSEDSYSFSNGEIYDFIIGEDIEPYKSIEEKELEKAKIKESQDSIMIVNAQKLLTQINQIHNTKSIDNLRSIFRHLDGSVYTNSEWTEYSASLTNWVEFSGLIKSSKINTWSISDNNGYFNITTEYEKIGTTNERLFLIKADTEYFVTFIGK